MNYGEFPPEARLAPIVHRIWTLDGHANELGGEVQPIIPDGRPEIIVHFGDPFDRLRPDGTAERQPRVIFAGQLTRELLLRPTGRICVLGVRLHPHGAAALFRQPQDEFRGLTISLNDVSCDLFRSLDRVRESTSSLVAACGLVQDHLTVRADPGRIDERAEYVVDTIRRHHGRVSVDRLAGAIGMTRRHLERRFNAVVGISPKRLARIARFQHALRSLESEGAGAADTAAKCGYADQAHFIRECRELTGRPPTQHLLRRAQLTGFFVE